MPSIRALLAWAAIVAAGCTPALPDTYPAPADRALMQRPDSAVARGAVLATGDTAYWDFQVTRAAVPLTVIAPEYSEGTRLRGAEGKVVARFAVDTLGAPLMTTFTIVSSPDYALSDAVQRAVAGSRFQPAELRGRIVVQAVEMPFNFTIDRDDPRARRRRGPSAR